MSDQRTPRATLTRENSGRMVYQPPSKLPEPAPEPGYVFRWVATHVLGTLDPTNSSQRFREGWEPVKASDHPEMRMAATAAGNIEIGGLMLCKAPEELMKSRQEYYERQAQAQMESVDSHFMRNNDPRMPLFREAKSQTTRGGGFGSGTK